jgi:hypothetical protein
MFFLSGTVDSGWGTVFCFVHDFSRGIVWRTALALRKRKAAREWPEQMRPGMPVWISAICGGVETKNEVGFGFMIRDDIEMNPDLMVNGLGCDTNHTDGNYSNCNSHQEYYSIFSLLKSA